MVDQHIADLLRGLDAPPPVDAAFDTCRELGALAREAPADAGGAASLDFIAGRGDLSGRLFRGYDGNGKRATSDLVPPRWHLLAALLLLRDLRARDIAKDPPSLFFKRANAVLKLRDQFLAQGGGEGKEALDAIRGQAVRAVEDAAARAAPAAATDQAPHEPNGRAPGPARTLPVTVLFWEGPIARAYLATLRSLGYRPQRILQVVSAVDLASRRPLGRWLPGFARTHYAEARQRNSIHYWPRMLAAKHGDLRRAIVDAVAGGLRFAPGVIDEAQRLLPLHAYSDDVVRLLVDGLGDDRLHDALRRLGEGKVLFTGGGIVPRRLLEIPGLSFIHVHPGYLPGIRGADCVLWSQLAAGTSSASCFLMAPGIDDGDVIQPCYLPRIAFDADGAAFPAKTLYRAVYAFFDPWVRSSVLRSAIAATDGLAALDPRPQGAGEGATYHFMHEDIQKVAFARLFRG